MGAIRRFEDIEAWQKSRELARAVYHVTAAKAFSRDFGLCNQVRRAATSVMANIAEGFERDGNREFLQFLSVAKGSCGELRSFLYVALDQGDVTEADHRGLTKAADEISRMLAGLMAYLRRSSLTGRKYKK